jgi:hypothetical protein
MAAETGNTHQFVSIPGRTDSKKKIEPEMNSLSVNTIVTNVGSRLFGGPGGVFIDEHMDVRLKTDVCYERGACSRHQSSGQVSGHGAPWLDRPAIRGNGGFMRHRPDLPLPPYRLDDFLD